MGATISSFDAFEIHIESTRQNGDRILVRSPAGEASAILDSDQINDLLKQLPSLVPLAEDSPLREAVQAAGRVPAEGSPGSIKREIGTGADSGYIGSKLTAEQFGEHLHSALFPASVSALFERSLERIVDEPQRGLSLRFHFDLSDHRQADLARLPWELLFDQESNCFLSQATKTPILRYIELPRRVPRYKMPSVLRILAVIAAPKDQDPLKGLEEADLILSSWEQDNVKVSMLQITDQQDQAEAADLGALLRARLRDDTFHILHFIGHGTFDPVTREGAVVLETADRRSLRVPGTQLGCWLTNHRSLRLVVLNACSTGQSKDMTRPFAGVAPALVRAGIPGVLAMQDPMPDFDALVFSKIFYERLAKRSPVEAALSYARNELYAKNQRPARGLRAAEELFATRGSHGRRSDAWATPVLFQRTPDILEVPPQIGPALAMTWTLTGATHLIFVGIMFLRNRSIPVVPGLKQLLQGDVAAFFGILFGLPIFFVALYAAREYCRTVDLPKRKAPRPLIRRIASRLPVAFRTRIQGRKINENAYQLLFLALFIIIPMALQGYLFVRMMSAQVWLQREDTLFTQDFSDAFTRYVPPREAILNDNYRLGSNDDLERPGHVVAVINNVTYFPFWEAWGLLLAELVALALVLRLLRDLAIPRRRP